jgi:hypothetical protein
VLNKKKETGPRKNRKKRKVRMWNEMKNKRKNNIRRKRSQTLSASWAGRTPAPTTPSPTVLGRLPLATESAARPATLRRLLCHPRRLLPCRLSHGSWAHGNGALDRNRIGLPSQSQIWGATGPPHRVVFLLALTTPSGSFGRPRSAPAGGRDGGVWPAAPDGPHGVREDVLRAPHHAR